MSSFKEFLSDGTQVGVVVGGFLIDTQSAVLFDLMMKFVGVVFGGEHEARSGMMLDVGQEF